MNEAVFGLLPVEMLAKQAQERTTLPCSAFSGGKGVKAAKRGKKRREMNATEAEFAMFLEAQRRNGYIERYEYEGITLRWPDGMRYTPDFVLYSSHFDKSMEMTLIEIKGAYSWQKDVVKFRAARAYWPMYHWEFWQKTANGWEMTR